MKKYLLISCISLVIGGLYLKLNDIQKEIEYFENAKDITFTRKEYEKYMKKKQ